MSWAAMARKAKDVPQPSADESAPKRVVAVETAEAAKAVKLQNLEQHTAQTFALPELRKGCLVLDANAFIKGFDDYLSRADVFITTPQVIAEVKDRHSRDLLERLPVELTVLDPTPASVDAVIDVAKLTGDLGTLSRTDIRLCALGLDVAKQLNALGRSIEPQSTLVIEQKPEDDDESDSDDDGGDAAEGGDAASDDDGGAGDGEEELAGWGGSDDEGEWITTDTMDRVKGFGVLGEGEVDEDEPQGEEYSSGFATATSDFPMQNVLMHLGVPVVGPTGMMIRELRQWLLRCHACFCLVTDTTRQFCPDCGSGNTLKRVSYTVDSVTGEKKMMVNFKHRISKRGTVFNLPKPRGGRNGTNRTLVLREDQLANCGRQSVAAKRKAALAAAAASGSKDDDLKGFGERAERGRSAANMKSSSSYHKFNVTEKKKLRAARRK